MFFELFMYIMGGVFVLTGLLVGIDNRGEAIGLFTLAYVFFNNADIHKLKRIIQGRE